ncbi:MAG: hypothetical protein IJV17_06160 [Prevotella sp.]|nr:hypothetical protein [Prevotella sp.]
MKAIYIKPAYTIIEIIPASLICGSPAGLSSDSQDNGSALGRELDELEEVNSVLFGE